MILGRGQRRLGNASETGGVEEQGEVGTNLVVQAFKRPEVWRGYWAFQELYKSYVKWRRAPINLSGPELEEETDTGGKIVLWNW
jgi:hypothetical protein